jgi:hypothetical protein
MTKKIVVGVLVALACVWAVKKTHVCSYAQTLIKEGRDQVRSQVPRQFELARVRDQIDNLDRDYQDLFGPVAEKTALVKRLDREIQTARASLAAQRESLLALTTAVDARTSFINYDGSKYSLEQAKVKLAREFATFKKLEITLDTREKQLEAERVVLAATREQLDKLITQKRKFEIDLAKLEAAEATLQVTAIQVPLPTDNSRVADIQATLKQIEERQNVEHERRNLTQQYGTKISDAPAASTLLPEATVQEIRDYLEGRSSKVVKGDGDN